MMDGYTLPNALAPFPDESLPGLVMRNADVFRFWDARRLLRRIEPPEQVLWSLCREHPDGEFGRRMATLLGLDGEARRYFMWDANENSVSILGHRVWRDLVVAERRMVCPVCLRDSAHHRAVWMVNAMPVCALHGAWLRDRCHRCSKPLGWLGRAPHRCGLRRCFADLREAPVEHADPGHLGGIAGLHRTLHAANPMAAAPLGMPFGELLRLSLLMGKAALGFERASRTPGFVARERARLPEILDIGWSAFQGWPNGFGELLERLRGKASERAGKDGLRKAFGILPNWVHEWAREPWGAPIGAAFAEHVARTGTVATTRKQLARYAPGVRVAKHHMTASEVQRALAISPGAVHRLLARRGLYALAPKGEGTPSLVAAADVEKLRNEARDSLTPEQARRVLGVGRRVFDQMEAASLVVQVPAADCILETKPFRRSDLQRLLARCVRRAPEMARQAADAGKLSTIISATAPGRAVADICRALLDGRLGAVAQVKEAVGLQQARLLLAEVERLLPSSKETLSLIDATKESGIEYQHLLGWAKAGLLQTARSSGLDERGMRVAREDWEAFRRAYATSGQLAHELGQPRNTHVSRHLRFLGVEPISGPGVDGAKLALFRRADVGPEMLARVAQLQHGGTATPQDRHRASFARVAVIGGAVARQWETTFRREHNTFIDEVSGRVLQVVSGRRPQLTGVFAFQVHKATMERLRAARETWVALVPGDGEEFLLMPLAEVPWKGRALDASYVRLRFDGRGRALEMRNWMTLQPGYPGEEHERKSSAVSRTRVCRPVTSQP